jgi:hypothetical protein
VAIPFKIRVGYLLAELLALALVVFGLFAPAGTVAAVTLQPLEYCLDEFLIFIQTYVHVPIPLNLYYTAWAKTVNNPAKQP